MPSSYDLGERRVTSCRYRSELPQNCHCFPSLSIRLPRRRLRTSESDGSERSLRIPTKACMGLAAPV